MDNNQPQLVGYLLLNEDGAVVSSSGDLENDEKSAEIIMGLINLTGQIEQTPAAKYKKLSLIYDDHCYIVCLSNRQVHIVKRSIEPQCGAAAAANQNNKIVATAGGDADEQLLSAVA